MAQAQAYEQNRQGPLNEVEIHSALSNTRRILILKLLRAAAGREMRVRELADRIAEMETDVSPPPRNLRKSVYVTLIQSHLPKLDDFGIVDYDDQAKTVALARRSEEVWVYLETVPKYGISWSEFYLGTACLGGLLLLATEIGVPLIAGVSPTGWATVILLLISGGAVYQILHQESSIWHRLQNTLE